MALCLLESELRKARVRIIELRKLYIVIESFCCKKMLIDLFWRLRSDLECLREVWNTWRAVQEQHTEWKRGRWQRINTKLMKKATEAQLDVVSALPDESNEWNVFIGMHQAILNIQVRKDQRRASRLVIVCFLLSTFGYNFFWEPLYRTSTKMVTDNGGNCVRANALNSLRISLWPVVQFSHQNNSKDHLNCFLFSLLRLFFHRE